MMKNTEEEASVFALCLDHDGYAVSLEMGKLYRAISDEEAAAHGHVRVIDESGETALYKIAEAIFFVAFAGLSERTERA